MVRGIATESRTAVVHGMHPTRGYPVPGHITLVPMVLLAPLTGRLVDRVPNRGLLLAAIALQGVPILVAALTGLAPGRAWVLVASLVVVGVGSSVASPTIAALLPHVSGEESR